MGEAMKLGLANHTMPTAAQATEILEAGNSAFTDGVKTTGYVATGFLFLGLLSTLNLGAKARRKQD
jgi:hypothetical protein